MNVFYTFTRRCLKQNKTRTVITVIGIVLSMALFTAVIEGAYSGVQYLYRCEGDSEGYWQGMEISASNDETEKLSSSSKVKTARSWTELGWAEIGSSNEGKPYLLVRGIDNDITDLLSVNITLGRMPENDSEILIPEHLEYNGDVRLKLGDELTLSLGRREGTDGETLNAFCGYRYEEEQLIDIETKTYTVVGFYERFSYDVESRDCPGYTALTLSNAEGISRDTFFAFKNPNRYYQICAELNLDAENLITHEDLLNFAGATRQSSVNRVIVGFAVILVILICFGSISLIYNSFAISVSERTKLFGILKSVGATKAQIRASVRYEALLLAGIGIPIGLLVGLAGIGTTLYCLRDSFGGFFGNSTTQMKMVISPWMLLLAAIVCLVTTLIAAAKPSRQAIKVSPIDSIRQRTDIQIDAKEVKTSKLTQKLFGFEGMMASKNFKRNKKRYRTVVMSLFMSVVLFIGTSSFCAYLKSTAGAVTSSVPGIDITYETSFDNYEEAVALKNKLKNLAGVNDVIIKSNYYANICIDKSAYTKELSEQLEAEGSDEYYVSRFLFIDDDSFAQLCKENKLDPEDFTDAQNPQGLLINEFTHRGYNSKGELLVADVSLIEEKYIPLTAYYEVYDYESEDPETESEPEKITFVIGGIAEDSFNWFADYRAEIIYPESARSGVVPAEYEEDSSGIYVSMEFTCSNHTQAYQNIKDALSSAGYSATTLYDSAADNDTTKMMLTVINVFCYGFIILISLIALANVFNTITTNISLRRRELAMLRSIGMDSKGFNKMMNYECIIYGIKGLGFGLPASILFSFLIYLVVLGTYKTKFFVPVPAILVSIGSVFIVVFAAMLFTMKKLNAENTIDALKNENI